ncbi:MAG: branched-chain amino acid ABC transporter permease [Gammaproteobacteria bacterium]|nr:branched-chain amino acid ABC transporter permease [Gammaproteobacteria bacterium]MDD9874991.1 branched-chain amino acid ABC transporter permease [Gammaproteobacteria bacterium]
MSGYIEGILVILLLNIVFAYAVYWPLAAGQLNLGVAGFVGIGAYASAYASNEYGVPPYLASLGAALVTFAAAIIIAVPVLRTRGIYLALATFAFGQVLHSLFLNLDVVGGAAGYPVNAYIGIGGIATCALGVFLVTLFLDRTRFGLNMVAVHHDNAVSDLFGINVRLYQTLAFAIGAGIAGLGGGLYGHHFSYIEPQNYTILFSIFVVLFVLLGGTQTVFGPLLGAIFFTLLPEALRASEEWRYAIFAVLIIGTMILRPQGLFTVHEIRIFRRLFDRGTPPGRAHG